MTESALLDRFRARIAELLGLELADSKGPFLAGVLDARSRAAGHTVEVYVDSLSEANGEVGELARELSVSETCFLRNPSHFDALVELLRARRLDQPLRVLSAGCCSGEEAYSIALVVHDTLGAPAPGLVTILGVDADPAAIARAREASYSSWSLRQTPAGVRARHFTPTGKSFRLNQPARRLVRFEQRNLARPDPGLWRPGAFDIIFCRNVLMYFTEEARRAAVGRLAETLSPGGYLFLGHAETLRGVSDAFHLEHACDTFFYHRRDSARAVAEPTRALPEVPTALVPQASDTTWLDTIGSASVRIAALAGGSRPRSPAARRVEPQADLASSMDLLRRERYAEALESLGAEPVDESREALLLRAVLLTHRGDLEEARATCRKLLALDELSADAHYVTALCCEHGGDLASAREHDETACYLEPEFAMPHLHLGLLARRRGDLVAARRQLQRALGLLLREEDATRIVLFGGGFSRDALVQLCRTELATCAPEAP